MTNSPTAPCPITTVKPDEAVLVSKCLKCGNEIKIAIGNLTVTQIQEAFQKLDDHVGECPGGYHIELCGWRRLWQLDQALEKFLAEHSEWPQ